ncbi:hypothetical protein CISG_00542 [Coccidioides immitis RMSCC 3703]|uniref:Uncharacterized protein n=1 Tax=Coccidioides immitis RMSCC 3703 TaxID=454286 RepID=A0A0J8QM00_COCIT|nr:hypothetical protein CISG_00542 [Coccidioides immitis RMSCC 3703]
MEGMLPASLAEENEACHEERKDGFTPSLLAREPQRSSWFQGKHDYLKKPADCNSEGAPWICATRTPCPFPSKQGKHTPNLLAPAAAPRDRRRDAWTVTPHVT